MSNIGNIWLIGRRAPLEICNRSIAPPGNGLSSVHKHLLTAAIQVVKPKRGDAANLLIRLEVSGSCSGWRRHGSRRWGWSPTMVYEL